MHLRTIRLRGFKSFVDPLELTFEPGVAVVVGPNGSGKSNVADAIVWAAGSLAPSELRAEKPDDVLFAGGGDRKQADHCEVELVFDNEDGGFGDLDYSEIAITRRLVRGGEGVYLVNRTPVRRIDLVELLADAGLGGSMHSIVSQGKVDAVLASKPEDRRSLIEEAAGLGKFKRRRHRAELKLARVATQVDRARDVEVEVRKRLRPLALQATAAERAEKLVGELAALRARIAHLDLAGIDERRTGAEERRSAAALARRASQERLTALLEERQAAEDDLSDSAGRREAALGALYRLQGAAERLELRREGVAGLAGRLREDLAEAELARVARSDDVVRTLEAAALAAAGMSRDAAQAAAQAAERARLAHARLAVVERRGAAAAAERLDALRSDRGGVEAAIAAATSAPDESAATLARIGGLRERLAAREETTASFARVVRTSLDAARSRARRGLPSPDELERAADEASARARAAASERDEIAERARSAGERLRALEQTIAQREGISPAAQALAAEGERLVLSELDVVPGTERAVAAALGPRASALLASDPSAGLALLGRARAAALGSLTVVVGREPIELVSRLPVVPLDELLDVSAASVTAEGFGYDPVGGELWFAGETAEAVWLEMDGRRRTLVDERDELAGRAQDAARAADEAVVAASEAEAAFAEVAHLRGLAADVPGLERLAGVSATLAALVEQALSATRALEEPLAARASFAREQAIEAGSELRRLSALEGEAAQAASSAIERAQAAEVVVARLGGTVAGVHVEGAPDRESLVREAAALLAASDVAALAAREASDAARAAEHALAERSPRRATLDPDLIGRLGLAADALDAALATASGVARRLEAPVRARVDAGAERAARLGDELRRLGAAEVEVRQHADDAAERATQVQIELARLDAEADEARRRLADAGEVEPASGDDREALAVRVARLDGRRESLGRVNPLAKEEYEEEKARLDELATQREDLEASLHELAKLRDELTETVERRFAETFATVTANFEEVAATLFPGGEGHLRLLEPDEEGAEVGVEVELRPAGKRITRLSLLSGGEKALGAIAFLFALFLARPCPFYLLDEVEAALDDTNIARFVELLRRYADRAQFVVITHQKRTMEAADVLYGVTMGADGVSQVVSRRLPQHDRQHALASA